MEGSCLYLHASVERCNSILAGAAFGSHISFMRILLTTFFLCLAVPTSTEARCVILLHGLARSDASLAVMEAALGLHGYRVVNHAYPSTEAPIDALLAEVSQAVTRCGEAGRVDFVTHSMGGILLRAWAEQGGSERIGRAVMLGPPNQGSELVDMLKDMPLFDRVNGPAGRQLGTDRGAVPRRLGPARFDVGVIAGKASLNPIYSAMLPGKDDGKVTVQATRLPGMADHMTIATSHTFMMNNPVVIAQTLAFLRDGRFQPSLSLVDALRVVLVPDPSQSSAARSR